MIQAYKLRQANVFNVSLVKHNQRVTSGWYRPKLGLNRGLKSLRQSVLLQISLIFDFLLCYSFVVLLLTGLLTIACMYSFTTVHWFVFWMH